MAARHYSNVQYVSKLRSAFTERRNLLVTNLGLSVCTKLYGGCIMLNCDAYAFIHTACVCFNLSIILRIKRTQMPTT